MWSESPIRAPRRRVAMSGVPIIAVPPESLTLVETKVNAGSSWSWPSPPGTISSAVAMVHSLTGSLVIPDEWHILAQGDGPAAGNEWTILACDEWSGTTGTTLTWAGTEPYNYIGGFLAYAVGSVGGVWHHTLGPESSIADAGYAAPTGDWWVQIAACTGVYSDPAGPTGVSVQESLAGAYAHLGGVRPPYTNSDQHVTWATHGAYGPPSAVTAALWWSPT